jgi:hypothetical protein
MLTVMWLTLSAMFRSFQEVTKFRAELSWVPQWIFQYRGKYNLDFYHFATTLHWLCMFAAGISYQGWTGYFLVDLFFIYVYHGIMNDTFYHFLWMKREHWMVSFERSIFFQFISLYNWLKKLIVRK